jgi:hypothetical protein
MSNYGTRIEKTLCAIDWYKDVTKDLVNTKHILTMTNSLIKHPGTLSYTQLENLKENKLMLEQEINIVTNDLAKDIFTQSIFN